MIVRGEFPFASTTTSARTHHASATARSSSMRPGRVEYASPNAVNALHRMGIHSNVEGARLDEVGVEETAVEPGVLHRRPVTEEIERRPDVTVLVRCLPLLHRGEVTGGLVLLRDVTDIRRRDRLLLSKDATIREVHHRVKNNLQTISSLLRLQARRLQPGEGRRRSARRSAGSGRSPSSTKSLSRDPGEQVAFDEIVRDLVRMAEEAVVSGHHVRFVSTATPANCTPTWRRRSRSLSASCSRTPASTPSRRRRG